MALIPGKGEERRQFPRTATDEYLFNLFKGRILARESRPAIGASVETVLENNPERVSFLIVNTSAGSITLGFSRQVSLGSGITLGPSGGFLRMAIQEDAAPVGWEIFGIGSGAGLSMYILQNIRYAARKGE